jgi:hypothetical protein
MDYAPLDSFPMPVNLPKLVDALVAKSGNQTQLAKRLGDVSQPQISRWRKGVEPERENYDKIVALAKAEGLLEDVRSEDVAHGLPEPTSPRMVKVKGYVGAGSQAHYYAVSDEEFEEVEAPVGAADATVAVEIRGKSMGPLLDTWIVFYNDVRSPITNDLLGQLCVVGLADDKILIKQIKRERDGSFTLLSNSSDEPIRNAQIEWAALVTEMRRRR